MSARANLFQVVTFATDPLHGNPAFVLSGAREASDHVLATACAILRTDIVAVVGEPSGGEAPLRFFTTEGPHAGAGHATMAAAHIVLRDGLAAGKGAASRSVTFHLANGDSRAAHLEGERISVDFPAMPGTRVDRVAEMEAALGARPGRPGSRPSAMSRSSTIPASSPGCGRTWPLCLPSIAMR